ncbi:hypothetical protein TrRE_jg1793, partial [Triparma retinervis]
GTTGSSDVQIGAQYNAGDAMVRAEAATTTPRPSFGLLVERESHDSTEIAEDERPTRNSSEVDSGEGEGRRRLKENSERTKDLPCSREYTKRNESTSANAISEVARLPSSQENSKRRESTSDGAAAKVEGLPSSQENSKRRESNSANAVTEVAGLPSSQENSQRRESTSANATAKVAGLPSSQENSKRQMNSANVVAEVAAFTAPPEPSFGLIRLEKV